MSGENKLEKAREIINQVDREMAKLFVKRMEAAKMVAEHKAERGLAILDAAREEQIIREGSKRIDSPELREYYVGFLKDTMKISRAYQSRLMPVRRRPRRVWTQHRSRVRHPPMPENMH